MASEAHRRVKAFADARRSNGPKRHAPHRHAPPRPATHGTARRGTARRGGLHRPPAGHAPRSDLADDSQAPEVRGITRQPAHAAERKRRAIPTHERGHSSPNGTTGGTPDGP